MGRASEKKIVTVSVSVKAHSPREARWLVARALSHDRFWKRVQASVKKVEVKK